MSTRMSHADFNWKSFLWKDLTRIREIEINGDLVRALEQVIGLIFYCPQSLKKEYLATAKQLKTRIQAIRTNTTGASAVDQRVKTARQLRSFAREEFDKFMEPFTTSLDKLGYMETRREIPEGRSHTL